jgi:hypothetical protein
MKMSITPRELARNVERAYRKAESLLERLNSAGDDGASERRIETLEAQYAEAWATASDLRDELSELVESYWKEFDSEARVNPFFGFFGNRKPEAPPRRSGRTGKSAPKKELKTYDVTFVDICDNVSEFEMDASNKQHALALSKRYMKQDGANLTGAKFNIALAE